ncbi:MAG: polysaccharide biosynthesis tyrosine autokinase [Perlucidibaca sp.]
MSANTSPRPAADGKSEVVSLSDIFDTLMLHRIVLAVFLAVGLAAGVLYATIARPVYELEALVQVESTNGGAIGASLQEMRTLFESNSEATTEIELIQSRMVLGRTARDLGLTTEVKVRRFPLIGNYFARLHDEDDGPSGGIGPFGWGGERIEVARFEVPEAYQGERYIIKADKDGHFLFKGPGLGKVVRGRLGELLALDTRKGRVELFVRDIQARPGVEFRLRSLSEADAVDSIRKMLKVQEKVKLSNILKLSLRDDNPVEGRDLLNQIARNYVRQNVERKSAEAEQTLKFLNEQLPSIKRQLDDAESRYNSYRARAGAVDVTKEGEILLAESVNVERQLTELQSQRKELMTKFGPEHPRVAALDAQIGLLESRRGRVGGRVDSLPKTQQEILRLTRDLKVNTEMYNNILNDTQQLRVAQAGTVGNVRVVDYAVKPSEPAFPVMKKVAPIGAAAGLFLGIAFILLRNWLQKGVKDAAELEARLGLTVLATIPESREQERLLREAAGQGSRVLAARREQDLAIEGVRSLRTALHFSSLDRQNNCTVLTGPSPSIGKTFLSVNLAALLAANGQRVLVVDADMRRGHMHDYFDSARENGLSEIIAENRPWRDVVRTTSVQVLDFVSTGVLPPNPSELLLHQRFSLFLAEVSAAYDHVLIDTPPVIAVTDAVIVGRHCGVTLLVARYGESLLTELELSRKRLDQAGVQLGGVVLNRVERAGGYRYHYDYYRTTR